MSSSPLQGAVILGALIAGVLLAGVVYLASLPEEPDDVNTTGYIVLSLALQSGSYYETQAAASLVVNTATDPDLRFVVEIIGRFSDLAIQAGVTRSSEADSAEGRAKLFPVGFSNPSLGQQARRTMFQSALGNFVQKALTLDLPYLPDPYPWLHATNENARTSAVFAFGRVMLIGIGYAYEWFK